MIKRMNYLNQVKPFIDKDLVKVLVGVRRSGKSVLLEQISEELISRDVERDQILYFNFESYSNIHLRDDLALYKHIEEVIVSSEKHYLMFDEIQEVTNWEKVINALRVDFNVDIYVTGSNANLLSGELATYLAGRYVEIDVYPFSFKEFFENTEELNLKLDKRSAFELYTKLGGFPFLGKLMLEEGPSIQYLEDIYRSVLLKDVVERNKIRDVDLLERIIIFIISNIGRTFSAKSITDYLKSESRKVSNETVYNYIQACQEACLLSKVHRQDVVGKKILKTQEKIFLVDHGIRQSIYGSNRDNIDQVLENIVFMELIRRGYKVTIGKVKDKEIDFIAERNKEKIYVQVTYLLSSETVIEREFGVFKEISDNYPKYVLSMDEFDFSDSGIKHMNIREFLMM